MMASKQLHSAMWRQLGSAVDMPLDTDVFCASPGHNAPQQVTSTHHACLTSSACKSRIQVARSSMGVGMAGRKRKAEAARVAEEEADKALYGAFHGAANSLSQLYALASGHQTPTERLDILQ